MLSPLQLSLPMEFDERKHRVDSLAQKYLEQASKSVQNLIPLQSFGNGNCLFNSVVSLVPDSEVSAVELRGLLARFISKKYIHDELIMFKYLISVRTIVELSKNRTHYIAQFANTIGPLDEALRRICNDYNFSELYELAALANVLGCDVQSVYPYIDYRAEMKIMNAVYKPMNISASNKTKLIIFWTSSQDELSTRNRPDSGGIWSPNHFVPLVQRNRRSLTASNEQNHPLPEVEQKSSLVNKKLCY